MRYRDINLFNGAAGTSITALAPLNIAHTTALSIEANITGGTGTVVIVPEYANTTEDVNLLTTQSSSPIFLSTNQSSSVMTLPLPTCSTYVYFYIINVYSETTFVTTVADNAGSLNNTYFTIDSTNFIQAVFPSFPLNKYYVWFNVDGNGTDPMIPNRIGVEVDISSNDSAATVASALAAAASSAMSADFVIYQGGLPGDEVAFLQNQGGNGSNPLDGTPPTGFTFVLDSPTGQLTVNMKTNEW